MSDNTAIFNVDDNSFLKLKSFIKFDSKYILSYLKK